MKRREVIKNLSILPVSGVVLGSVIPFGSVLEAPAASTSTCSPSGSDKGTGAA